MDTEHTVLRLVAEISGHEVSTLTPETPLVGGLGIDSTDAVRLLIELEEVLEIEISDEAAAHMDTVGDILEFVRRRRSDRE